MNVRMTTLIIVALGLGSAAPARAQFSTGRIDVTVTDASGAVLPGVAIDVAGPERRTALTDNSGEARFLNLPPGIYAVTARLQGFTDYVNRTVPVTAGSGVPLRVTLAVAGVTQSVEVIAAPPMFDPKRSSIGTSVTSDELQVVPSARDPWVILQTIPGVVVDRVNVGGAESGQQSNYLAKGAGRGDNTWHIDGIPITDMAALGASPVYYDFDMFEEMQITTGGADISSSTPGVAVNLILKTGTNRPRGSARVYFANESLQGTNLPDFLVAALGGPGRKGNRMEEYLDAGVEFGGPVLRDRVWAWGAAGKTHITVRAFTGTPDATFLKNVSFKATGQATGDLRGSFTYYGGVKQKFGRDASVVRPEETSYDQDGPTRMLRGEVNYAAGSSLFLTARAAHVGGWFQLTPQGGLGVNMIGADDAGIARNSFYQYRTDRPQQTVQFEGSYFHGRHEVKAGAGYRRADVDEAYTVPGNGVITYHSGYPSMIGEVTAWNQVTGTAGRYVHGFIADTVTFDRLTITAGLRWDRQAASVLAYSQAGNALLPSLLPDLAGQAARDVIVWRLLTPRVAVTYALSQEGRTSARAGYAALPSQMSAGEGGFFSTVGSFRGVYFFDVFDENGNGTVDQHEIAGRTCTAAAAAAGACNWYGFNIADPGNAGVPNHRIGDYGTPVTHEIVAGIDHELMPNLGLSATFTWRRFVNFNWRPVEGLRGDDFVRLGTFAGNQEPIGRFSVPFYGVTGDAVPANRTATEYVTRPDYRQRYVGLEIAATRRLSGRWMARLGFSTNDHREYFGSSRAFMDPTPTPASPNADGGQVMRETAGSGKTGIFMVLPKYQLAATGMYRARWGIALAASLLVRQGYAMPYHRSLTQTGDALDNLKTLLLVDVDDFRLPPVTSLDARAGKSFAYRRVRASLDLDVFNVLNLGTILRRQYDLRVTTADSVLEIMNPRLARVGLRVAF